MNNPDFGCVEALAVDAFRPAEASHPGGKVCCGGVGGMSGLHSWR